MAPIPIRVWNKIVIVLSLFAVISQQPTHAQCIASGPNSPGQATTSTFTGSDFDFDSPTDCITSDDNRASASSLALLFSGQTRYLRATNFGFSIPTAASICGIQVEVEKSATNLILNLTAVDDYRVRIIKGNTIMSTDVFNPSSTWTTSDAYTAYGGSNELWGTSWTPNDINSANFGFAFAADIQGVAAVLPQVRIDHIRITVYYLDPTLLTDQAIHFKVIASNNTASLSWNNPDHGETVNYDIQRSENGVIWEPLTGITQKNVKAGSCTFTDTKPLPGRSYYRLKVTNPSGAIQYSENKQFTASTYSRIKAYPNPCTSYIHIAHVPSQEQVTVTNIYGQQMPVRFTTSGDGQKTNVSTLLPGIYFINAGNQKIKFQKK